MLGSKAFLAFFGIFRHFSAYLQPLNHQFSCVTKVIIEVLKNIWNLCFRCPVWKTGVDFECRIKWLLTFYVIFKFVGPKKICHINLIFLFIYLFIYLPRPGLSQSSNWQWLRLMWACIRNRIPHISSQRPRNYINWFMV